MEEDVGGPYPVTRIPHFELALPGDEEVRISLKIWYPSTVTDHDTFFPGAALEGRECLKEGNCTSEQASFPAILEYIPYRHSDFTVCRDESRHPWIVSHGYVFVRADLRGTGNSNGLYFDEYTLTEQEDGIAIIEWLKDQSWCNGRVGMYGKSWGGFNGLQIAYREPKGLSSVISLYSTDNRFTDDIHYKGGCVIGSGMLSWASWMLADQAKPPHPKYCLDWKKEWKNRLENACTSWADIWLSKQTFDDYWANGSICTDYNKVKIPVCIFGGWVDSYKNAAFRMANKLPQPHTTIGPWSHDWPDTACPGPNIGFLDKCLEFWNATLKENKTLDKDLIWYQCKGTLPPSEWIQNQPGRWLKLKKERNIEDAVEYVYFDIQPGKTTTVESRLSPQDLNITELKDCLTLKIDPLSAQEYSEYLSFGDPDQAGDVGPINLNHSDTWTLELPNNKESLSIFGQPIFEAIVKGPQIIVRLNDVFPDGQAKLLSIGVLNLEDNLEKRKIQIILDVLGYDVQPFHKLSLSLSPLYFPLIWPPKSEPILQFYGGILSIPKIRDEAIELYNELGKPRCFKRGPITKQLTENEYERSFQTLFNPDDTVTYEWKTISDSGKEELIEQQIISSERREEVYRISSLPPFEPEATTKWNVEMRFPTAEPEIFEAITIQTNSKMTSNNDNFILHHQIHVCHGKENIYCKDYEKVIPREL